MPVAIGSRAVDVLCVLVQQPGDIVSKDRILNAVWPDTVVEDNNLTVHISALRRILDGRRSVGSCIQTVAGRGYRFVAAVTHHEAAAPFNRAVTAQRKARPAPHLSIVVLPITNLSTDPEQEYFADAITDDLTTDLSRIAESFVIARTTAFTYTGKMIDVRQVAHELGVRYVLEGSVRSMGHRVQVNVQLIDGETGSHVWADRFDTDRRDLAKAQSEIVGRLARTLNAELISDIGRRVEQERETDLDARDLVMRARALRFQSYSVASHRRVMHLLERALTLDPSSVDAKIQIAALLASDLGDGLSASVKEDVARAERLSQEVLERDPNSSLAHAVIALLRRVQGRWAESQVEWEIVIAVDPNDARAIRHLGQVIMIQGQPEAAIPYMEKAIRLDPRAQNAFIAYSNLANCYLFLDRIEEAVSLYRKARALNPGMWYVHLNLAGALGLTGHIEEAKREIADALQLKPDVSSIAALHASAVTRGFGNPHLHALREKTTYAGLRLAGFPDE